MKSTINQQYKAINKADKILISNINMFLLQSETLKGLFWSVTKVEKNREMKNIKIGINTSNGKLGTTLEKMRTLAKNLSEYLYERSIINKRYRIYFSVHKEDLENLKILEKINSLNIAE